MAALWSTARTAMRPILHTFCSKWRLLCSSWERRNYSALHLFLWLGRRNGLKPLPVLPALRKNTCTKYIVLRCFATRHKICKRAENEASSRNGQLLEFAQQVSCLSHAQDSVSSSVSAVSSTCTRYSRSWVFTMFSSGFLIFDLRQTVWPKSWVCSSLWKNHCIWEKEEGVYNNNVQNPWNSNPHSDRNHITSVSDQWTQLT